MRLNLIWLASDELFVASVFYLFHGGKRISLKLTLKEYNFSFVSILSCLKGLNGISAETYDYMFAVCWIIYLQLSDMSIVNAFASKYVLHYESLEQRSHTFGYIWSALLHGCSSLYFVSSLTQSYKTYNIFPVFLQS